MKLIELHILQSFPVSCLNRDDVGAPKSAVFGGVNRSRISSQCLKRAARTHAASLLPEVYRGERTRLAADEITKRMVSRGFQESEAQEIALTACCFLVDKDGPKAAEKGDDDKRQMPSLIFLSPMQYDALAALLVEKSDDIAVALKGSDKKKRKKAIDAISSTLNQTGVLDAADIALFGRMVANDATLNVEGAAMFSHALSTHRSDNDLDFFSAIDDVKAASGTAVDAGAGMIGTLEFTSACYYRFCALNLDLLADEAHLQGLETGQRKAVVDAFLRGVIEAIPNARKNSMNAHVKPAFVLGVVKSKGQPVQLVNAFENPIAANGRGFIENSTAALREHQAQLAKTWGISSDEEVCIPDTTLDDLVARLVQHVA